MTRSLYFRWDYSVPGTSKVPRVRVAPKLIPKLPLAAETRASGAR